MRSVLKGLGWSISLVRSNDLQLGQVRETTKHPTERDIGRLEVAHIVHTATLKVLKLKLNPSNPSREKVETVGERRLHIPLQPFVRSAAFVKVGSLPPFDRLQHVHTIGAHPSARTAHSCHWDVLRCTTASRALVNAVDGGGSGSPPSHSGQALQKSLSSSLPVSQSPEKDRQRT